MDYAAPVKKTRKTQDCIQKERLQKIEELMLQALNRVNEVQALGPQIKLVLDQVAEHDRALKGKNGTVGIIAKVAGSADTIEDLNTTIRGKGEDPGLVGKIDKLVEAVEGLKDDRKWLTRLIVGWVVMTLLGVIGIMMTK